MPDPVDPDDLINPMSEHKLALLMCIGVLMFSVVELGAKQQALLQRLTTHETNFRAIKKSKAAATVKVMMAMVQSTVFR